MALHNFEERLAYSQRASHEPFWEAVYRKAFPDLVSHVPCPGDVHSQRLGIDRVIVLASGRVLKIDEKKRDRVYDDILLEYVSNTTTDAPGWMDKPLQIDYLAYAFMPLQKVYLFDWLMLRRAWLHYRDAWKRRYKTVIAKNVGYDTLSLAVPIAVVQQATRSATVIQLDGAL